MQKYQSTITATNGSVIRNVPVTVIKEDGSLAEIFMDREGKVQAPNPLVTDSRGVFYFYAKNGRYSLRTAADGVQITDADTVLLFDPDETASDGPIADAVRRAEDAAERAETALGDSGLQNMVQDAQNAAANAAQAVIDAHQAVASIDAALIEVSEAKEDAQAAAQTASNAASDAQAVKDSLLNYDGTLSATPEWSAVPAHEDSNLDAQTQAALNRIEKLKDDQQLKAGEVIEAEPSWSDVPKHKSDVFNAQAQALANRTEIIKSAVLSYPDYAAASAAAATLPDGQVVFDDGEGVEYQVNGGALVLKSRDLKNLRARIAMVPDVKDFEYLVAKTDPLDPMTWDWWPAFRAALNTGATTVTCREPGVYRITDELGVNREGQRLRLGEDVTLLIDAAYVTKRAVKLVGKKTRLIGGIVESVIRRDFVVECSGEKSMITECEVTHATPPAQWPLSEDVAGIPYNKGGISLTGTGARAIDNEVSNILGMGVLSYGASQIIEDNHTHHNSIGVHVDHANPGLTVVSKNLIEDNDSVGVLANHDGVNMAFMLNTMRGNGSHGAYLRCHRSMVGVNFSYGNRRDGIKVRDADGTVVFANATFNNNTEGSTAGAELRLQINDNGAEGVSFVANTGMSTNPATTLSFNAVFAGTSRVNSRMSFIGNVGENASMAHSDKLLCMGNSMAGKLIGSANTTNAPTIQSGGLFANNQAAEFVATNRFRENMVVANIFGKLTTPTDGGNLDNRLVMNQFTNQDVVFERRFFREFSYNFSQMNLSAAVPALREGNNASDNSFKRIIGNQFVGAIGGICQDSSSSVSGSYNTIIGNVGDSPSGGPSLFSIWGSNHAIIGNINSNGGNSGYVGCSNSWMIGNIPKFGLRSEASGNQNI